MRIWILAILLAGAVFAQDDFFGARYEAIGSENIVINFSVESETELEKLSSLYQADRLITDISIGLDNLELSPHGFYLANESKIRCIVENPLEGKEKATYSCSAKGAFIQYANYPQISSRVTSKQDAGYLGADGYIKTDIAQMVYFAESLWVTDDIYSNVFDMAEWVSKTIVFLASGDEFPSTSQVLDMRYTNVMGLNVLFVSMCRAMGLSSRVVEGMVLRKSNEYDVHYWSEVYIGGQWIPYDIYYKQYGYIDATHIRFRHLERIDSPAISKRIPAEKDIEVRSLKPEINAEILTLGNAKRDELVVSAEALIDTISYISYNLIEVKVKNDNPYYAPTLISMLSFPYEIELIGHYEQALLIPPRSSRSVFFLVKTRDDLDTSNRYLINITIETVRGDDVSVRFDIARNGKTLSYDGTIKEFIEDTRIDTAKAMEIVRQDPAPRYPVIDELIETTNDAMVLRRHIEVTDKGNQITISISPKKKMYDFMIYEEIPKCLAKKIDEIIFNTTNVRVINPDPLMVWEFDEVDEDIEITYTLKDRFNISDCKDTINTVAVARIIGDEYLKRTFFEQNRLLFIIGALVVIPGVIFSVLYFGRFSTQIKKKVETEDQDEMQFKQRKDQLKGYVKQYLANGYSKDQITQLLKSKGWPDDLIRAAIKESSA